MLPPEMLAKEKIESFRFGMMDVGLSVFVEVRMVQEILESEQQ